MDEIEFTNEELNKVYYLAGHLSAAEQYPEDPHSGDSRELGLDLLKEFVADRESKAVQRFLVKHHRPVLKIETAGEANRILDLFLEQRKGEF